MGKQLIWVLGAAVLLAGCAPVISESLQGQVDPALHFKAVLEDPRAYEGKTVIWGGVILETHNREDGTVMEVLQKPLDWENRPKSGDQSDGRFLLAYSGFLDPALYKKTREVTAGGRIAGEQIVPLDEMDYRYPVLRVQEIHLWPVRQTWEDYPWPPFYGPYSGFCPYSFWLGGRFGYPWWW